MSTRLPARTRGWPHRESHRFALSVLVPVGGEAGIKALVAAVGLDGKTTLLSFPATRTPLLLGRAGTAQAARLATSFLQVPFGVRLAEAGIRLQATPGLQAELAEPIPETAVEMAAQVVLAQVACPALAVEQVAMQATVGVVLTVTKRTECLALAVAQVEVPYPVVKGILAAVSGCLGKELLAQAVRQE